MLPNKARRAAQLAQRRGRWVLARIEDRARSQRLGALTAQRRQVEGDDVFDPAPAQGHDRAEADRAHAEDRHALAGLRVGAIHRVRADRDRLDERGVLQADLARNAAQRLHVSVHLAQHDVVAEAAALAAAADVGRAVVGVVGDAVAGLEAGDAWARPR